MRWEVTFPECVVVSSVSLSVFLDYYSQYPKVETFPGLLHDGAKIQAQLFIHKLWFLCYGGS